MSPQCEGIIEQDARREQAGTGPRAGAPFDGGGNRGRAVPAGGLSRGQIGPGQCITSTAARTSAGALGRSPMIPEHMAVWATVHVGASQSRIETDEPVCDASSPFGHCVGNR